jgi:hypothetical protein
VVSDMIGALCLIFYVNMEMLQVCGQILMGSFCNLPCGYMNCKGL